MLKVQEYLKFGKTFEDLKNEFGIKYSFDKNKELVILNYDQIESPKKHPIVMECRSLILEVSTFNIVSKSFYRFFNYGEEETGNDNFDFKNAFILEKVDGSLIHYFNYKNQWRMATRGVIDGENFVGDFNITFKELFNRAFKNIDSSQFDTNFNYIFELVSPENKVVKYYSDSNLYLIGMRDVSTWHEVGYNVIVNTATNRLHCKYPQRYFLNELDSIKESFNSLNATDEGYVVVNQSCYDGKGNYRRIKVKNPSYLALAHLKDKGSTKTSILTIVRKGEEGELLSVFPEYEKYVNEIKSKWDNYINFFETIYYCLKEKYFDIKDKPKELKKEFALIAKDSQYSPILFSIYDGKCSSIEEYYKQMDNKSSEKATSKKILEILKINDKEFNKE